MTEGEQPPGREPGHESGHEPVGSASDEAAKLFGALADWAREHGADAGVGLSGLAGHAAAAVQGFATNVEQHIDTGAPECTYCPVCRTVHVIREVSPEIRDQLAIAATSLMNAATTVLKAAATPTAGEKRSANVEPIRIDDLDDGAGWPSDDEGPDLGPDPDSEEE